MAVLASAAFFALAANPASAAIVHPFQAQITEAGGAPIGIPLGLAVDSTGNLYLADGAEAAPALDKFDSSGAPVTAWGTNGQITEANGAAFTRPYGLALEGSDNLWASDVGPGLVDKFGPSDTLLNQGNGEGNWSGEYTRSIAFSQAAERLFLIDSGTGELWALKPDATVESGIANFGTCCFFNVAADNSPGTTGGDLYVSGEGNAVFRIHGSGPEVGEPAPFAASGEPGKGYIEGAKLTGGPNGPFGTQGTGLGVRALAVDSTGNLFVGGGNGVFEFAPSGAFLGKLTGTPTGPAGAHEAFGELTAVGVGAASGKLYVANSANHVVDVFGPGLILPEVTTKPATNITTTSATFNGEVNPAGLELTGCAFEYGETTTYGQSAPCGEYEAGGTWHPLASLSELGSGNEPVPVRAAVSALHSGATYHFGLTATNANGTNTESGDQSFFTGAAIDSTSVSSVSATSATLEAEINPHGLPTTYHFEYDTVPYVEAEASHGTSTPTGSAGSGTEAVFRSAQVQGLEPTTVYHCRVVATNSLGTVDGPDTAFTTQGAGSSLLPDSRAWEMVTPPNKFGSPLEPLTEEGGLIQAAGDGSAFASVALGPLGPDAPGVRSPTDNQWLSGRGAGGWSTQDITTPDEEVSIVSAGHPSEYQFFSVDLSSSVVEPLSATPLSPQTTERTPYRREADGEFVPLVTAANVLPETEFGGSESPGTGNWGDGVGFRTATPDLSHVVLVSPQHLAPGFQSGFEPNGRPNLYELSAGALTLISVLPNGEPASEAGFSVGVGSNDLNMRGAVSNDGTRVFFEAAEHLYLRDNAPQPQSALNGSSKCTEPAMACTFQLDTLQQGAAGGAGQPQFQAASEDGARVFFTDEARLTSGATAQPNMPDLYMCEIEVGGSGELECALSDLSVDQNAGEAANVASKVSAIDASGSHVYFAANGVLTNTPNARGEIATPGNCETEVEATCNLYEYDTNDDQINLVAVLSSADSPDWNGHGNLFNLGNLTARSSPDGRYFAFMSQRSLTGYDNRDARSGRPDAEVFLFDSVTGTLKCASCNPTGARPLGVFDPPRAGEGQANQGGLLVDHSRSWSERWLAASIPGWTQLNIGLALYQSRYLSNSGRLFFNAADALVPSDTNRVEDVYQYEPLAVGSCTVASPTFAPASGGCVDLISSGTSGEESAFLDASESGNDVFFLTASRLTAKDVDHAFDVYDASVGGGEAPTVNPPACEGDACQNPAAPPEHPTPGTALLNGPGNVVECPKGKVKRHGRCVRKHKAKKHHRKHKKSKRASNSRGGAK